MTTPTTLRRSRRSGVRAFTMLELVVGAAMVLAIASATLSVLLSMQKTLAEAQIRNAATRDSLFALDMIGEDLRYLGVGVPFGESSQAAVGITPAAQLRPPIRIGEAHDLVFMGDLPYPDADFNGTALLQNVFGAGNTNIVVTSELSGCPPAATAAFTCDPLVSTFLDLGALAATDSCSPSQLTAATCPWSLNKWRPDASGYVPLVISAPMVGPGMREWAAVRWDIASITTGTPKTANAPSGALGIVLDTTYPAAGQATVDPAVMLGGAAGIATVSHVDRVFYTLEASTGPVACPGPPARCVIRRRQCWGSVLGANTSAFPKVGATSLRSNQNPIDCLAPTEGTPWEPIIGAVEQLDFQYFDEDGAEIAVPLTMATSGTVRRIDVTVTVARTSPANGDVLRQRMTRGFWVNNAAGRLGGGKP